VVQGADRPVPVGRIVTAGDATFKPFVMQTMAKAKALGYRVNVYDLGGLGFGEPLSTDPSDLKKDSFVPCTFKPLAIRRALLEWKEFRTYWPETHLVWLDADAFLQTRIEEVFTDDYDVGVTERPAREIEMYRENPKVGRINSGVIFFRCSEELFPFLDEWESRAMKYNLEQQALNELVSENSLRFKMFPCQTYNNYLFDGRGEPKVVQYKGNRRARLR